MTLSLAAPGVNLRYNHLGDDAAEGACGVETLPVIGWNREAPVASRGGIFMSHSTSGSSRSRAGTAGECRGALAGGPSRQVQVLHYPGTPQADGAPRYLPSQHDSDLPIELVTLIDLPCTPEVPGIHLLSPAPPQGEP